MIFRVLNCDTSLTHTYYTSGIFASQMRCLRSCREPQSGLHAKAFLLEEGGPRQRRKELPHRASGDKLSHTVHFIAKVLINPTALLSLFASQIREPPARIHYEKQSHRTVFLLSCAFAHARVFRRLRTATMASALDLTSFLKNA